MIMDEFTVGNYRIVINSSLKPIQHYLSGLPEMAPICVDIGASDGLNQSNSLFLYMHGWQGLSIEANENAFATLEVFYGEYLPWVKLCHKRITPQSSCQLLERYQIPQHFGFLSLDIDSFDYEVLAALLQSYRPTLICAEINEKIPPPLRFWVPYRPEHVYTGDHFYGMSLQALADLATVHDYQLVGLCFNNAFLIAREHNTLPVQSPTQAYAEGYLAGHIPAYNRNLHLLQSLDPEAALAYLNAHFAAYAGLYIAKTGL
jgi:hypothetical protein